MSKKGLSQVVTTVIMILLILVAIGSLWAVVSNLIGESSGKINTDQFTLSLTLERADINYTTGIASVRVKRNTGEGNLTGIKFIVEDSLNSDVFEERFTRFPELAVKTFELNLTVSEIINVNDIQKISIAPIYAVGTSAGGSGGVQESVGGVAGSTTNINSGDEGFVDEGDEGDEVIDQCVNVSDCGENTLVGVPYCNQEGTAVMQYQETWNCSLGFCSSENIEVVVEACVEGNICYDAECIIEPLECSVENVSQDCGEEGFIGGLMCHPTLNATAQDYANYSCIDNKCQENITTQVIEECGEGEICYNAECFTPIECSENFDCWDDPLVPNGEVCEEGECVPEVVLNSGTIQSIWPFGVGEYFDSPDLPSNLDIVGFGNSIVFPGSSDSGCYRLQEFVLPEGEGNSYVRLNSLQTNISAGDNYEIWETGYPCTML